ncbi:hypothetical protein TREMEDRAFT_32135 [Tremella mesenterica DSM 1558]|uniref:uncharacterized protein n=1 Tax=Tremella mesenterica (strain ATCC 24925 / CBS 8224 / DSM 1558 / NBRC 9311 / NRRL Y-6157 / RJB 2259-6 / UBC 559-6) TaxID=578456 RepID=UPI0003F4A129|nr:uncharacterized protein TREMEDRAFT_32135 [Tremella mesenterica DSM 1558]EIW68410.1 hypothetical protein TREMEDRAFT_32135 [Tremella mesenterica DSM 1558]
MSRRRTQAASRTDKNVVMASHGRAPWYGPDGKNIEAYVIGIAGGSASGKTSVARAILSALNYIPTVLILSQDSFYCAHTPEEVERAFRNELDLDHPDSIDMTLFARCVRDLKQGRATEIPVYSFVHHQRMPEKKYIYGASVIIVEGIMALQSEELRRLYDLKVFVNCDSDLMLARRIIRDTKERGRDVEGILDQYLRFVKSSYDNFVQPSSRYADIIVPGFSNQVAIELLVTHIKGQVDSRSLRFRNVLARIGQEEGDKAKAKSTCPTEEFQDHNLVLLEQTNQLLGIMTILRDEETERGDFIFYTDRLATLVVEKALTLTPFQPTTITTPLGVEYHGMAPTTDPLVGVSILRSGGPFSYGLRRVIRDVQIGAMLIQSDPKTGEPLLLSSDLPQCIKSREESESVRVLLLDSQMGTGAAAMMAIRILLDHGIPQPNIILLTFLVARQGLHSLHRVFPQVRIVTAAVDQDLHEAQVPLHSPVMGEAIGEADLAVHLVNEVSSSERTSEYDLDEMDDNVLKLEQTEFRIQRSKIMEDLKFSRKHKNERISPTLKRAWVVSPGKSSHLVCDLTKG